jgi:hypothetical protein
MFARTDARVSMTFTVVDWWDHERLIKLSDKYMRLILAMIVLFAVSFSTIFICCHAQSLPYYRW